ncbi:MAG: hypothetical protein V7L00_13195 [Nostoc sp.]|uniref:hypothetical protein n=1 Tax=Nostoc sp. TaxID=1180 RepID=UPI002FFBB0F1
MCIKFGNAYLWPPNHLGAIAHHCCSYHWIAKKLKNRWLFSHHFLEDIKYFQ